MAAKHAGVRTVYAGQAPRYDERWADYLESTLRPTLDAMELPPAGRVVDVGCGTGLLLEMLLARHPGAHASGVDLSPEMLSRARSRLGGRAKLLLGDAAALPLASSRFDAVVSSSALHHWPRPERALGEIARVLRPGGQLVVTDWSDDHLPTRLLSGLLRWTDPSHHRTYSVRELRGMLQRAGFRAIEDRRYRLGWRWGFMTLTARTAPAGAVHHPTLDPR